jgi:hypothetical protein
MNSNNPIIFEDLSEEDLLKKDENGESIIFWALKNGVFDHIPKRCITQRVLLIDIPNTNEKLIHLLAKERSFNYIPKDILTEELLSVKGMYGKSAYHLLANQGTIKNLPSKLLTKSALTLKADNGWTPLHTIAGTTPNIIPDCITLDDLLIPSNDNTTPLESWTMGPSWMEIPDKYINSKTLLMKDNHGICPLDCFIKNYEYECNHRKGLAISYTTKIKSIFTKTPNDSLKELRNHQCKEIRELSESEISKRKMMEFPNAKELNI